MTRYAYLRFLIPLLFTPPGISLAQSILVEEPQGTIIKLVMRGSTGCGVLEWEHARQSGFFTILDKSVEQDENKLPLNAETWRVVLTRVAGNTPEVTIAHNFRDEVAGLAAAIRVARDIRSHGGLAWALNGQYQQSMKNAECKGEYRYTEKPSASFLSEDEFWHKLNTGQFLDARGKALAANPPSITWIAGSPLNAKAVNAGYFVNKGKVTPASFSCDIFNNVSVVGCDSIHKAMLAAEAALYANCQSQPAVMPYWGLSGASRSPQAVERLWGKQAKSNPRGSNKWWVFD